MESRTPGRQVRPPDMGQAHAAIPAEEAASERVLAHYREQVAATAGLRGAWRVTDAGTIQAPVIVNAFPEEDPGRMGPSLAWVAVDWFRHIQGWCWRVALEHRVYHYFVPREQLPLLLRVAERLVERAGGVI